MHWTDSAAVYHPREPKASPLWHLLHKHFDDFQFHYDSCFIREYGFLRPIIPEVVRGFLKCGKLANGFVRVRCSDCHHEYLLAFSCRGRWFRSFPVVAYLPRLSLEKGDTVRFAPARQSFLPGATPAACFLHSDYPAHLFQVRPQTSGQALPVCQ